MKDMKNTLKLYALMFGVVAVLAAEVSAQVFELSSAERLAASIVPSHKTVTPGQTFHLAIDVAIEDGWVFYSPDPGKYALAARVDVKADGLTAGKILWPTDKQKRVKIGPEEFVNNVYKKRVVIYVPLTVPAETKLESFDISVTVVGQVCSDRCENVEATATAKISLGDKAVENQAWTFADDLASAVPVERLRELHKSDKTPGDTVVATSDLPNWSLWTGLSLALLAGLILNIMPCVLPVIPLKVMSIFQMAKESRRRYVTLGLSFSAGILIFFAALAIFNIVLKMVTEVGISWGQHFQSEAVVIAMVIVLVALAANMFGAFNVIVPSKIMAMDSGPSQNGQTHLSAVGMGIFTGILATPCSFAILTAALLWAQGQSLLVGTLAIMLIGVGMAFPYALLTAFPGLVSKLPKPGRWMELFKQSMGFVLLLVAVFLVSSMGERSYPFWVMSYTVVLAFCLWMWGNWVRYDAPAKKKWLIRIIALVLAVGSGAWMLIPPKPLAVHFEEFNAAQIESARKADRIVLIDFTAKWCVNCKTLEALVYTDAEIADKIKQLNVLAVTGDVTTREMPAAKMLYGQLKEGGVPVTVIFPPGGGKPIHLRGIFSKSDLLQALDIAAGRG